MPDCHPTHYRIRLESRLAEFRFSGGVDIALTAEKPADHILLNVLELAVWQCRVEADGGWAVRPFTVDPEKETLKISLPREMQGEVRIQVDFEGHINDRMAGFYRSRYDAGGEERYIAVTQFEESDARRAFPCFDHPARKATFDVEIIVERGLTAISNGAVAEEEALPDGRRRYRFERTPRMSTYLLFFGVGEFDRLAGAEDPRVCAATVPGKKRFAAYGLDFGSKALQFSESYYGVPYPMSKLELIAVPDFAFGAMENWGAITFRENLLLHYPGVTSRSGEERICEVIAHEIAHQWFGNLVTPAEWKYLWLNESFATYFGFGVVDHHHPDWEVWASFIHSQTDTAFERDALFETFAIEIPGGEHVVINTATAPIIYNKGGSILRQVEGYIGPENFKNGLRRYLQTHAYGCAASHDLWDALEAVSQLPVSRMMLSWVFQPGFPLVTVRREGDTLAATQRRFTYLPSPLDPQPEPENLPEGREATWLVPLEIRVIRDDGAVETVQALMDGPELRVELGPGAAAYKLNAGQAGFYRVRYRDDANLAALGAAVRRRALSPEDRWGLQNDLYALVRSGDLTVAEYLDFLGHYENEDAFLPLISIGANLYQAHRILDGGNRQRVAAFALAFTERILAAIGFEPAEGEPHPRAILRDQALWHAVACGSPRAAAFCREAFGRLAAGEALPADIMKSTFQAAAFLGGAQALQWLTARLDSSESEHERMNLLTAVGCVREEASIAEVQRFALEKVPDRNKFFPIAALAANPHAAPLMWDWYLGHLPALERFHPLHYERVIAAVVPSGGLGREAEVSAFFSDYLKTRPQVTDVVRLSLELLEINRRMRAA